MQAQNKVDNDVITVTDSLGNKQDIDIPEGMFVDVDSLLHLYNSRTYLQPDCLPECRRRIRRDSRRRHE